MLCASTGAAAAVVAAESACQRLIQRSVLQIIAHLQIFAQSQLLTGGGPNNNSRTLVQLIYEYSFRDMRMGSGAAVSVVLFLIIGFFTFLQFRLFKENE